MPSVPTYNLPQETERALPAARQESVVSPALLDAGAEQNIALGKSIQVAGTGIEQVAFHMARRETMDVLHRTDAEDQAAALAMEAEVRAKRMGSGAKGVTTETATWWKDRIAKNAEGMTSEQARLYQHRAMTQAVHRTREMSHFESAQTLIGQEQNWKAATHNTINLAAATPTPGVVGAAIEKIKRDNAEFGASKGWTPEMLQAVNGDDFTKLHKQAIQTLAANPATQNLAAAYYKEHEREINGTERAEIGLFAEKATAARLGSDTAQAEWKTNGPKGHNDASDIAAMKQNIREKLKDNPYARDAALHEISQLDTERDKTVKAFDNKRHADINTMRMQGMSMAAVMQTPAWNQLDGTEQRKFLAHEEDIAYRAESRAAARANRAQAESGRAYTEELRKEHRLNTAGLDMRMRLEDPTVLASITDRNEIVNLRTTMGSENTLHALAKYDAYKKDEGKLKEAKIDNDQFKVFAQRAGLDITPKASDDEGKERLIQLRDNIERVISMEEKVKKKPLTREEKDVILKREIDNTIMQKTGWFRFDKEVPAIALPADAQKNAYVVVGDQQVRLSEIDENWEKAIRIERKQRNLPINEKIIAELWLKKKGRVKSPPPSSPGYAEIPAP